MNISDTTIYNIAENIATTYDNLLAKFNEITSTAKELFETKQYQLLFSKQQERYKLYSLAVKSCLQYVEENLLENRFNTEIWSKIKINHTQIIKDRAYKLNSETFYNSITRKIFYDKSFNFDIEYFDKEDYKPVEKAKEDVFDTIFVNSLSPLAIKLILQNFKFEVPFENLDNDAYNIFEELAPTFIYQKSNLYLDKIEILKYIFYRNRGAFIVGRFVHRKWKMPFVIPLLNEERGVYADSIIHNQSDISVIFSFTRASFMVNTPYPAQLIDYLKKLLPYKGVGELYDSIGYYRHGKTILYRDFMNYVMNEDHNDKFIVAPGIKGMVMCVFTLKYYNFVFKIIKDKFEPPKNITRQQVIKKYEEVEFSDRVGRMAYAHLFENLEFPRKLFSFELIQEFTEHCKETVEFKGDKVIIKHVYLERKMTPLNIYLNEANHIDKYKAILDYGYCIKELAAANIFPGDLLLKNFGVTRHGRVIFYDYDEIQKITELRFRKIPQATEYDERFGEIDVSADINDIFPEEFKAFMAPDGPIGDIFLAEHDELFDAKYWRSIQKKINNGIYVRFFAYDKFKRFRKDKNVDEDL
jgi:isocitrate dehydrogenase kinase/phosphatase